MTLSSDVFGHLDRIGLKRAPSGIPQARNGVFGLLGAHHLNLSEKPETTFRIPTDLRKKLRDAGLIIRTESDGNRYLYAHGLVLHPDASAENAEARLKRKIAALQDFLLTQGVAVEPEDVRVHIKGFNLKNNEELADAIQGSAEGLRQAIRQHAGSLKAMHSLVFRIKVTPQNETELADAFAKWKKTRQITRASGKGGSDVLMARAYQDRSDTVTMRISKRESKGRKPTRRDIPGQKVMPFYRTTKK